MEPRETDREDHAITERLDRSLLLATLESTADGILVIDRAGRVVVANESFRRLWRIPDELRGSQSDEALLGSVTSQLADPDAFYAKVKELYADPGASSFEVIELRDGRAFERTSRPHKLGEEIRGRVWSFRDVTDRRRAQQELRQSEARARAFFEVSDVGMAEFDLEGRWIRVNPKLCQMLGRTEQELLGLSFSEVTHPDDVAQGLDVIRRLVSGEVQSLVQEKRYLRRDGTGVWVLVTSTLVRDAHGLPLREVAVIDDLRSANVFLNSLVENIPDTVFVKDAGELRYLRVNRAFEEQTGLSRAQVLGKRDAELFDAERARFAERADRETLTSGRLDEGRDEPVETPRGRRLARTKRIPISDEEGRVRFLLGITEDVTERHRVAEALARAHEQLERRVDERTALLRLANRDLEREIRERKLAEAESQQLQARLIQADRLASLGTLAAGVAHEINNPLAFVMVNLEMVQASLEQVAQGRPPESPSELLAAVRDARAGSERIRKTVRELRTFSRASEDRRLPLAVPAVLELSIAMSANELRHRATLVREIGPVPMVEADEGRLSQVFINLLVNAAQSIPEGDAGTHTVRVTTRTSQAGEAVIEVADDGAGIDAAHLGRIFEPFFTTKPVGVGTGLGLSVCHGIISALGGTITAESEKGKGSTFRVTLPPAKASSQPSITPVPPRPLPGRRGRVLVIDDEPMVGASVRRSLREHEVVLVTSGPAALELLRVGARFDVILCDLMMPQMPGPALYAELERDFPDLCPRVVFITGGAFTDGALAFLDRVQNERLEKPFEVGELQALVRRMTVDGK